VTANDPARGVTETGTGTIGGSAAARAASGTMKVPARSAASALRLMMKRGRNLPAPPSKGASPLGDCYNFTLTPK
jgi:hypothetical protein